jgi:hypothetical protein
MILKRDIMHKMGTTICHTYNTLGHKRKEFCYSGSIQSEVVLHQSGQPKIKARFFAEALKHFAGQAVYGGFKEDDPPSGGFGEWVQNESPRLNSKKLTPRHGSFIAAILCREAGVIPKLDGNAVVLLFPAHPNHNG